MINYQSLLSSIEYKKRKYNAIAQNQKFANQHNGVPASPL